jgi:uncharacterized caspase-like protein
MKNSRRAFALCALLAASAHAAPHRRALLIGINDYSASRLGAAATAPPRADRDWTNLAGAVNDANAMREMLVFLYGFDRDDIVTLTDQAATREAILRGVEEHLIDPASKDDVVFFYFAGHGSQVRNSLSEERDKFDESLVPADSRIGAPDIRDKELRSRFNRILDRGARLTVMLDNCHSGSGARGLGSGARPRGIKADLEDVADRVNGPQPEQHGALVLSAAQDFDRAWETRDNDGKFHGVFSWAWIRAMRDAAGDESAEVTFERAAARMRGETPFQQPVLAGKSDVKLVPFLGTRADHRDGSLVVAVEKVESDGTIVLHGGWANGLTVGTELRDPASAARITVTALSGLGRSEARAQPQAATPNAGALLEVSAWAAPPGRPLRIWMPRATRSMKEIAAAARSLLSGAREHGVRWVTDPIDATPSHVLRWGGKGWELFSDGAGVEPLGSDAAAVAAVDRLSSGSTLFVQFPAPALLVDAIAAEGIQQALGPEDADYVLVGRLTSRHLSFSWVRPCVKKTDRRKTGLPLRTAWVAERKNDNRLREIAPSLRRSLLALRKIHAWQSLESPPGGRFPYQIGVRRSRDDELIKDSVMGDERYELVLRTAEPLPARVRPRYVYAFVIDSYGKSTLLFPTAANGSVENRFPDSPPETEIPLGHTSQFEGGPPYGVDTYFLLSTEEPLTNPAILEWDGVRAAEAQPLTALEKLLLGTTPGTRSISMTTHAAWSIERTTYESLPPHTTKAAR